MRLCVCMRFGCTVTNDGQTLCKLNRKGVSPKPTCLTWFRRVFSLFKTQTWTTNEKEPTLVFVLGKVVGFFGLFPSSIQPGVWKQKVFSLFFTDLICYVVAKVFPLSCEFCRPTLLYLSSQKLSAFFGLFPSSIQPSVWKQKAFSSKFCWPTLVVSFLPTFSGLFWTFFSQASNSTSQNKTFSSLFGGATRMGTGVGNFVVDH